MPHSEIVCWIVQFNKSTAKKPPIYGIFEMRKQSFFLPIQQLNKEFTQPRSKNLRQDKINKSTAKKHLYMKFLSWLNRFFFNSTSQQGIHLPLIDIYKFWVAKPNSTSQRRRKTYIRNF